MAKKTPTSKKSKRASSAAAKSKKPARSTKKKPASAKSTARQTKAAKTSPRATSAKGAKRRATPSGKKRSAAAGRGGRAKTGGSPGVRKTVDNYVATLNDWRKDCVAGLRTMIRKAVPKSSENVKWSQPVYEHHGPFAWIKAHAKHVNLGFWRGVELSDPRKLLKGTGEKMRHIKLSSLKDAGKKELQEFVRLAARLNEIKGSPTQRTNPKSKRK